MSCRFDASQWILVTDSKVDPENTALQKDALQKHGVIPKGELDCELNGDAKPCHVVPKFPAWCNTEVGKCWFGTRTECEHFDELDEMATKQA